MPFPRSPAERQAIARMGANALVAKGLTNTAVARQAFRDKFLDQVDPERAAGEGTSQASRGGAPPSWTSASATSD